MKKLLIHFGKFNFLDMGEKIFAIDNVCAKGVEKNYSYS